MVHATTVENDRETVSRVFLKALSPGHRKGRGKKMFTKEKKSRRNVKMKAIGMGFIITINNKVF